MDTLKLVVAVLIIVFSITWAKCQWDECRDSGLSRLYCVQHIG